MTYTLYQTLHLPHIDSPVALHPTTQVARIFPSSPTTTLVDPTKPGGLTNLLHRVFVKNPNLHAITLTLSPTDHTALVAALSPHHKTTGGKRVAHYLGVPQNAPSAIAFAIGKPKPHSTSHTWSSTPTHHNVRALEVADPEARLPVCSLPTRAGVEWLGETWGSTTPIFEVGAQVVAYPLQPTPLFIGAADPTITVPPFSTSNTHGERWVAEEHWVDEFFCDQAQGLDGTPPGPGLHEALRREWEAITVTEMSPIFDEGFPAPGQRYDGGSRLIMYAARGAGVRGPPIPKHLRVRKLPVAVHVGRCCAARMREVTGLPIELVDATYITALGGVQHLHRQMPRHLVPEGEYCAVAMIPVSHPPAAQGPGQQSVWVPGSSRGFPEPWEEVPVDVPLGGMFLLNALCVHAGGGAPPPLPGQAPEPRGVLVCSLSTGHGNFFLTEGVRRPFWAQRKAGGPSVPASCAFPRCRGKAAAPCYQCQRPVLCRRHAAGLCPDCTPSSFTA